MGSIFGTLFLVTVMKNVNLIFEDKNKPLAFEIWPLESLFPLKSSFKQLRYGQVLRLKVKANFVFFLIRTMTFLE